MSALVIRGFAFVAYMTAMVVAFHVLTPPIGVPVPGAQMLLITASVLVFGLLVGALAWCVGEAVSGILRGELSSHRR